MFGTGFRAAKVTIATTVAVLAIAVAGAAALVLPSDGDSGAAAVHAAGDQGGWLASVSTDAMAHATQAQAGADAQVSTPDTSASASGSAGVNTSLPIPPVSIPPVSIPNVSIPPVSIPAPTLPNLPDLPNLSEIPSQVLQCLTPIQDLVGGTGIPSFSQISQLGPQVASCITAIVQGLPLPSGISACVSEVMGFVSAVIGQLPHMGTSTGGFNFNVAACIPSGLPVPTGFLNGLPFSGGGLPFGG